MAFDLRSYLNNFQIQDTSPTGLQEAADAIIANSNLFDMIGQSSPVTWAREVKSILSNVDDINAGRRNRFDTDGRDQIKGYMNDAVRWITGGAQSNAASSFQRRYRETISDITTKIANDLSNIANVSDIPANVSPAERAKLIEKATQMQANLEPLLANAKALNISIPTIKKIDSGFIPTAEATMDQGRTGRETESTLVKQDATNGQYNVVGALSGEVKGTAASEAEALALQNQRQLGSTPTIAGRPDLLAITPTAAEGTPAPVPLPTPTGETKMVEPKVATPVEIAQATLGTLDSTNKANGIPNTPPTTLQGPAPTIPEIPPIQTDNAKPEGVAIDQTLAERVDATNGALIANNDFINAVFKAYHGRDATAQELQQYAGKTVADVRNGVIQASPMSSDLPSGARKLNLDEFNTLRQQFGASPENFDKFFTRIGGDIYLNPDAFKNAGNFAAGMPEDTPNAGDVMTSQGSKIQAAFANDYSTSMSSGTPQPEAFVQAATMSVDQLIEATKSSLQKQLETKQQELFQSMQDAGASLEKRGQTQLDLEKQLGIGDMVKKMEELRLQIAARTNAFNAGNAKIMDQAIPQGLLVGQSASLQRQAAVEVGALSASLAAITDNMNLAKDYAKSTVDLMFADEQQKLDNTKMFLEVNQDMLSSEEQKSATKLKIMLDERQRVLDEQKDEKAKVMDLMLAVAKAGGDASQINLNGSLASALKVAQPSLAKLKERDTEIVNTTNGILLVDKQTGDVMKNLGTGTSANADLVFDGNGNPFIWDAKTASLTPYNGQGGTTTTNTSTATSTGARTDRSNNPIAFAVASNSQNQYTKALDQAGIKWTYGDAFPNDPSMVTVKVLGDGVEAARAVLANSNAIQGWYLNSTGKEILNKYGISNNTQFQNAPKAIQDAVIQGIYQKETGTTGTFSGQTVSNTSFVPKTTGTNSNQTLSDTAAKTLGFSTTLQDGTTELMNRFRQNYTGTLMGLLLGTDRQLVDLLNITADAFGRVRSGGAVNDSEAARFKSLIANWGDIISNADNKTSTIERMLKEANIVSSGIQGGKSAAQGVIGGSSTTSTSADLSGLNFKL